MCAAGLEPRPVPPQPEGDPPGSFTMSENATKHRTSAATKKQAKERTELYEFEADAIKALAHPKRLLIIDLLSDGSERTVSELQSDTGMSQANLSQNLALLRTTGLVTPRRDGNNIHYRLSDPRVLKAVALLRGVLGDKAQDTQFLMERAAQKQKDRIKNGTVYGVVIALGLFAFLVLGAATHPLWEGESARAIGPHVSAMLSSSSFGDMAQKCIDVTSNPAPPMTSAA